MNYQVSHGIRFIVFVLVALASGSLLAKNPKSQNLNVPKNAPDEYKELKVHKSTNVSLITASTTNKLYDKLPFNTNDILKQQVSITPYQNENEEDVANPTRNTLILVMIGTGLIFACLAYYIWLSGKNKYQKLKIIYERQIKQMQQQYVAELKIKSQTEVIAAANGSNLPIGSLRKGKHKNQVLNLCTIKELSSSPILTKEDWQQFKEKFTSIYPLFFTKIRNKGYVLTQSEERLLALEKLQLRTSEMANILGISPKSFLTSRYRLKKKLNISKEECLIEYMES